MSSYDRLPDNLPRPVDDGACDHLIGMYLPTITLTATDGSSVTLSSQLKKTVIYCYPMTGKPGVPLPEKSRRPRMYAPKLFLQRPSC